MTRKSNELGRAYEFACIISLYKNISEKRTVKINQNSSYFSAENAWKTLTISEQKLYQISALSSINTIFELEPRILDESDDILELEIQPDEHGENGDVRDILIIRRDIQWEIGLSVKHNHFAVKHSRLSKKIDFGKKWYNISCSEQYWEEIKPIFDFLDNEKKKESKWSDLGKRKETEIYIPLLNAFKKEINLQYKKHKNNLTKRLVEYLLGRFDFYKVISIDNKKITQIQSYNLRGTLNKQGAQRKRGIEIPKTELPTRIISLDYRENSKNTLELYLDKGWQFSFRIHNAKTKIETSLKFDIQIVGMPATIISINCKWLSQ